MNRAKLPLSKKPKKAYDEAPGDSEAKAVALQKWIDLCSTTDEVKEAHDEAPKRSEAKAVALQKMYEIYTKT